MKRIPQGIVISCDRAGIPTDEKNLCHKAAKRYLEKAGLSGGVHITLEKHIPDGAGMGGGSADAAAVLKGMKVLYPSDGPLEEIALSIGADVPFFLSGKTAFCQGIGEKRSPLSFPAKKELFCVAAKNCEGLSTPTIYSLFDSLPQNKRGIPTVQDIKKAFESGDPRDILPFLFNDLELCAVTLRPEIALLKAKLLDLGADGALMTGSGSAVFGLFLSEEKGRRAAELLKKETGEAHFCTLL